MTQGRPRPKALAPEAFLDYAISMNRLLLALVLAAGWAPMAVAGEWRSMEQLHDCAAGGCWEARDADSRVVVAADAAGSKKAALAPSNGARFARRNLAGLVAPLGKDEAKSQKENGGLWGSIKRGTDKAWGFVKDNWPGIAGGVVGGVIGSVFFGPIGGVIGSLIGTLLGHFAAGLFGKKS